MRLAHRARRCGRKAGDCAQRLSASMRLAQRGEPVVGHCEFSCSTPFGIYEVGTYPALHCSSTFTCAQRLSASMRLAQDRNHGALGSGMCSTPFGIYEVGTTAPFATAHFLYSCAQRLSASMRLARSSQLRPSTFNNVLNAFRHL